MSAEIRGVLFDKDGTLIDFHRTWVPTYREAARRIARLAGGGALAERLLALGGLEPSTGRCAPRSPLACASNAAIASLWARASGLDVARVLPLLEEVFDAFAAARPVPATELGPVLSRLRSRGLLLGLATMDSEALAHATLERLGVRGFFRFVCGYDSGFGEKPAPGMASAFCAAVGLEPDALAVVGDTPHDLDMARNAGAGLAIGVLSGASTREMLAALADHVIADISELDSVL